MQIAGTSAAGNRFLPARLAQQRLRPEHGRRLRSFVVEDHSHGLTCPFKHSGKMVGETSICSKREAAWLDRGNRLFRRHS